MSSLKHARPSGNASVELLSVIYAGSAEAQAKLRAAEEPLFERCGFVHVTHDVRRIVEPIYRGGGSGEGRFLDR
jgi:hypothetical protein